MTATATAIEATANVTMKQHNYSNWKQLFSTSTANLSTQLSQQLQLSRRRTKNAPKDTDNSLCHGICF
jgi:hypothetical protein